MAPMAPKPAADPARPAPRHGARGAWLGLAAALALSLPARAQPPLPSPEAPFLEGRLDGARATPLPPGHAAPGGLGYPFGAVPAATAAGPPRPWSLTPSLGLELLGTDNVNNTATDRQADLITRIMPSLAAEANTARLTGRLFYAPVARIYAETRGQNGLDHQFSGQALATLLEDRLFLDLRGYGALQATRGGFVSGNTPIPDRSNQVQTASLQASPYLVHRFGGLATAQIGYSYQYFSTEGDAAFLPGSTQPFFTSQEASSHQGYAVIRTDEDFGRLAFESRTVGTVYESDGVLAGAHRLTTTLQARYALTRAIAVLVEGGYEDQHYGGTQPLSIQGPIWSVGLRLTPDPDSVIIAKYGRRNGYESAYLNASFRLGGRTRVFATYADQIETAELQATDLLSTARVDALGNLVDSTSGAPLLAPFGDPLLATQSSLFRLKRASLGISQIWPRDTLTLTAFYDDRRPVTSTPGTVGFAQEGYSLGLSWARMLTPDLSGLASLQYGHTQAAVTEDGDVYTANLALAQELAPGLFGSLQYIFRYSEGGFVAGDAVQNIVILGLRQVF